MAFKLTPFVFPIKTALDWASTKTSLQLFDWFKFLDAQYMLLVCKYSDIGRKNVQFGKSQPTSQKIVMGWVLVVGLLGILLLPLLFFSTFNPFSMQNAVQDVSTK